MKCSATNHSQWNSLFIFSRDLIGSDWLWMDRRDRGESRIHFYFLAREFYYVFVWAIKLSKIYVNLQTGWLRETLVIFQPLRFGFFNTVKNCISYILVVGVVVLSDTSTLDSTASTTVAWRWSVHHPSYTTVLQHVEGSISLCSRSRSKQNERWKVWKWGSLMN